MLQNGRDFFCFLLCSAVFFSNFLSLPELNDLVGSSRELEGLSGLIVDQKHDNALNTGSPTYTLQDTTNVEQLKPFCLTGPFYGGTGNNVMEVGKLLRHLDEEGKHRKLGLDKFWTKWYKSHFDARPEVLFDYFPDGGDCEQTFEAQEAFFFGDWDLSYLKHLTPSLQHRQTAEAIIKSWPHGNNYVSVHRRHLDGTCHISARCPLNRPERKSKNRKCVEHRDPKEACSVDIRLQACDMEYNKVDNPKNLPVILFTDRQVPELDATFPQIFNTTTHMFVEMWLMTQSHTHWGNPRSTVDLVVSSWRRGMGMEPRQCYSPEKIFYML
mmetsp:Transcript_46044/g.111510  ORF Transcript_46044/g.111510 Transcript_46044/m.111510 type:complete len:326 (-) Transcript_46044:197-1174(-)|eukprot:CAMPEP_0113626298 /NCGR_PEP_ID=MMETSP0017_2-20120614/13600_1 /TAXON_ID=2856 /ORGANISM="Cylindrotheca closterium" /LENGTH=325 /DNA_ID=CAMNT_0000536473 /DNA_START=57 /DNA_END=1034 /DNA_ORIENTATION=- /assembly_acc=CAM_ASM_000147